MDLATSILNLIAAIAPGVLDLINKIIAGFGG